MRQLPDQGQGGSGQPPLGKGGQGKRRKNQFHFDMGKELYRVLGTDLTLVPGLSALTVHTLVAEVGSDLSRFANAAAFTSWLALCPGSKKSGGKVLSSKTRKTNSRLSVALRLAAQTLHRSHSYLGAFYRRLRARLGAPQAITATAHKLARIIYHLVTTRTAYDEGVFRYEEQKHALRSQHRLQRQAQALGFQLVPISSSAGCSLGAYPDFLLHRSHQRHFCGSPQREPHAVDRSYNSRQEIRGSQGICGSTDLSWKMGLLPGNRARGNLKGQGDSICGWKTRDRAVCIPASAPCHARV